MAFDLKGAAPDTSLPTTGFIFGADSQAATDPSIYDLSALRNALLGSGSGFTGVTVTANAPPLDISQTWNNAAVTFNGFKLNITDTASAAGSFLATYQVGGSYVLNINKNGDLLHPFSGTFAIGMSSTGDLMNRTGLTFSSVGIQFGVTNAAVPFYVVQAGASVRSDGAFAWSSTTNSTGALDVLLTRVASGVMSLKGASSIAGVVALGTRTVAALPTAAAAGAGSFTFVSDASATTPRSTVAGGGANFVMVMSNGTNWLIVA